MTVKSKKNPVVSPCPHILIQSVRPVVDGGRYPVKRLVGQQCDVEATIFRDGHSTIRAVLQWRRRNQKSYTEVPMELVNPGLDLWRGRLPLEKNDRYFFTIEAWTDVYASWLADFRKRVDSSQNVQSEVLEGVALIETVAKRASKTDKKTLSEAAVRLKGQAKDPQCALEVATEPTLLEKMSSLQPREDAVTHESILSIVAERTAALFGSWYEMFPRSQGTIPGKASTLREAERRFPDIRKMGFDVLYLPPVHPIGKTHRKGRNNSLEAGPDDPGSPWAIGNSAGGHDALEPGLGTMKDFDHFVQEARKHGLEIALDFALQCSPDHPWVEEHPDWFYQRPDGTIKYAENPPKKYEDIYPLNFDSPDREALWQEVRRIFDFWIGHGVRIFRVDNPHTKPPCFWEWILNDITSKHPDVLFLAEAFTRPPMMKTLAKLGFTQSYTYFTWREDKKGLRDYLEELTQSEMKDYYHPNFFVNTPDILPTILVRGGRPAFKMRTVLAATLSPSYGIYSGFELCENEAMDHHAIPGEYEYGNSEKYEIRVRDWNAPGNIVEFIARMNGVRKENPALQELANLKFLDSDNDRILCYAKATADFSNVILVAVNLDPHNVQESTVLVPSEAIGLRPGESYDVQDLLTGARYSWSARNYVRLDPNVQPAHVFRVERRA